MHFLLLMVLTRISESESLLADGLVIGFLQENNLGKLRIIIRMATDGYRRTGTVAGIASLD